MCRHVRAGARPDAGPSVGRPAAAAAAAAARGPLANTHTPPHARAATTARVHARTARRPGQYTHQGPAA